MAAAGDVVGDDDVVGHGLAHERLDAGEAQRRVEGFDLPALSARERHQLARDAGAAVGGVLDGREEAIVRLVEAALAQHARSRRHHHQQVVEIVRDAAGHAPQRLHAGRPRQHLCLLPHGVEDAARDDREEAGQGQRQGDQRRDDRQRALERRVVFDGRY